MQISVEIDEKSMHRNLEKNFKLIRTISKGCELPKSQPQKWSWLCSYLLGFGPAEPMSTGVIERKKNPEVQGSLSSGKNVAPYEENFTKCETHSTHFITQSGWDSAQF